MTTRNAVRTVLAGVLLLSLLPGCTDQPFTVSVPLRVVSVHPSGDNVPRDTVVEVSFSENVTEATVTDPANLYVEDITDPANPAPVAGTITYDAENFLATITPAAKLLYSTDYRVTVTRLIDRARDNAPLPVTVTGTFRTLEPPPLRLVGSDPGANSLGVPRDATITLTFSEPVNCASVEAGVSVLEVFDPHPHTGPGELTVTGSWTCSEPDSIDVDTCEGNDFCVVTFVPDAPFKYSSDVTITLQGGARADGAVESYRATDFGGQLPEDMVIGFHVEDPPAFYLGEMVPGAAMQGVERDVVLSLLFSEPVDCDTLALNSNFTVIETLDEHPRFGALAGTDREVSGTLTCNAAAAGDYACGNGGPSDPCRAIFTPDAAFEWSSLVTVTLHGVAYTPGEAPADRAVESTRATSYDGNLSEDVITWFRVEDPPPLAVTALDPGPNAEMVDRDATLGFTFSEALNCASINDVTVAVTETADPLLGGGTSAVSGALSCTDGDAAVSFAPDSPFGYSSVIGVTLLGGPFDAATYPEHAIESAIATTRSGQLPADLGYHFTASDPPPLYVIGTSPAAGSIRVATDADVQITFSEAVDCSSVTDATFLVREQTDTGADFAHAGSITCTAGDPVVVFDTTLDFQMSSTITVTLDASIRSTRATSRGGTLGSDFVFSFSTADPPPLLVVATSPGGSQDNVSSTAPIIVTFSEAVEQASVSATSFVVEDISDPGNPVALDCGDPAGSFDFSGGDVVVTCVPALPFEYDATIQVTLTTEIRSAIATSGGGNLPFDVVWSFDVIPVPPIEVIAVTPPDGEQNVSVATTITVEFNQDILQATLVTAEDGRPCAADGDCPGNITCDVAGGTCNPDPANITIWINEIIDVANPSDVTNHFPLDLVSYDENTLTAVLDPVGELLTGKAYNITVRGGLAGVRGRFGASIMVNDFLSDFTTGINALLAYTEPADTEVGVPVSTEVCAVFLMDIDPATVEAPGAFTLAFTDAFGTHGVPISGFSYAGVDPNTREPDVSGTYTNNRVCAEIAPEFWDCHPDARQLLHNTEYTATLADSITSTDGSVSLTGGYAWSFATGGPAQVDGAQAKNHVVTVDPLDGGTDVPVNSVFHVIFLEALDPASVDATTLELLDDADAPVAAAVTTDAGGLEAVLTPDAPLDYGATHTLRLHGGLDGVTLADGNYLEADLLASFTTSPPTYASVSPPQGVNAYATALNPIVFTRDVYFPSLTTTSIYAVDNSDSFTYEAAIATSSIDTDSCIYTATPTFVEQNDVTLTVTRDVQDFRGNPLAAEVVVNYPSIQNTPAVNARTPNPLDASHVSPASGSAVAGDQVFTLTMSSVVGNLKHRHLPTTFNNESVVLEGLDGTEQCPAEPIPMRNTYIIGPPAGADQIDFQAERYLRGGCNYRITFYQDLFANIYTVGNGDAPFSLDFAGETDPPTLVQGDIHLDAIAGDDLPADGRTDVWPRTAITAAFSENMHPLSLTGGAFDLQCDAGAGAQPVAGSVTVEGAVATFVPLSTLAGGADCTATLFGGATDVASNGLGGSVSASFTVEQMAPSVTGSTPGQGDSGVAHDVTIEIVFSEAVDPATLLASVAGTPGAVQLWDRDAGEEVFGCIEPGSDEDRFLFVPWRELEAGTQHELIMTTDVADFGGTPLSAQYSASFTTAP